MNAIQPMTPTEGKPAPKATRRPATAKLSTLAAKGSATARKLAAAILEVLAGGRTPAEAAAAAGVGLPRYYALEALALAGLIEACEPKPPGKRRSAEAEAAGLRRDLERARRESARYQALLRASQRAIGLAAAPARTNEKGKRRRKPTVRALKAVSMLQSGPGAAPPPPGAGEPAIGSTP